MSKFSLHKLEEITGKISFYKLFIDGICLFEEFETQIVEEGNWGSQLKTIYARIDYIANGHLISKEKFRDITPDVPKKKKGNTPPPVKEYEIKTPNLRVYLIEHTDSGKIIICAGKKTTQPKDIKAFRKIKEAYLESLNDE